MMSGPGLERCARSPPLGFAMRLLPGAGLTSPDNSGVGGSVLCCCCCFCETCAPSIIFHLFWTSGYIHISVYDTNVCTKCVQNVHKMCTKCVFVCVCTWYVFMDVGALLAGGTEDCLCSLHNMVLREIILFQCR